MALKKIYSDCQFGFRKLSSGDVGIVYDEKAINQSLKSLFNTKRGARFFNPEYGTEAPILLFDPIDETTADRLLKELNSAIKTWEGARIEVVELKINIDVDNHKYIIDGTYLIKNTLDTGNFTIKLEQ